MKLTRVLTMTIIALTLPLAALAALDAEVVSASGKVEVRETDSGPWTAVSTGMQVPVGATISTSFNASAELRIGESTVSVSQLTRIRIDELVSEGGTDRSDLNLRVGRMSAEVRSAEGGRAEFRVRSPIATASVRGTDFEFDGVNLSVSEGIVLLANRFNEAVAVLGGEESTAAGDGPPPTAAEQSESDATVTVSTGSGGGTPTVRTPTRGGLTINWQVVQ